MGAKGERHPGSPPDLAGLHTLETGILSKEGKVLRITCDLASPPASGMGCEARLERRLTSLPGRNASVVRLEAAAPRQQHDLAEQKGATSQPDRTETLAEQL